MANAGSFSKKITAEKKKIFTTGCLMLTHGGDVCMEEMAG